MYLGAVGNLTHRNNEEYVNNIGCYVTIYVCNILHRTDIIMDKLLGFNLLMTLGKYLHMKEILSHVLTFSLHKAK